MENRIWEIIAASIHGEELSQEEISTLQVWLDENKQNRDEYARLQIFYAENKGSLTDNINVQRAWEDNYARRKAGKMIRLRRKIVRWGYAAVVTLVIGVGVLLLTEKDDEQAVKVEFVESQIVPAVLYIFDKGGHGWGMRNNFEYHNQWTNLLANWLKKI